MTVPKSHRQALPVLLWVMNLLTITAFTSYGTMELSYNNIPWLSYNKPAYPTYPSYTTRSPWYPIVGPYTYGPPPDHATLPPQQSSGFHQQQIVHIHDGSPPDLPHGDNYQEGNDYNIHNIFSHVESAHDLEEVASSNIEKRKQVPETKRTTPNRRKSTTSKNSDKIRKNQNKMRRRRPETKIPSKMRTKTNNNKKNPKRKPPPRQTLTNNRQDQRKGSQKIRNSPKRKTRPTRKTHSRPPQHRYNYYNKNKKRRRHEYYKDDVSYHDFNSGENFARQDDYYDDSYYDDSEYYDDDYYDSDYNDDDYDNESDYVTESDENDYEDVTTEAATTTEVEATTGTPTTVAFTTINSETTPIIVATTAGPINETTSINSTFEGYGPSNGNENISITYPPVTGGRFEYDSPFTNFWYMQHGSPNAFHYQNYFSSGLFN